MTLLDDYRDVLSVDELAELLMLGRNSTYKLLNSGCLGALRVGRCWKIPKSAVIDFLQSQQSVLQPPKKGQA